MRLIITSLVAGLALAAGGSAGSNARESVSNVTGDKPGPLPYGCPGTTPARASSRCALGIGVWHAALDAAGGGVR